MNRDRLSYDNPWWSQDYQTKEIGFERIEIQRMRQLIQNEKAQRVLAVVGPRKSGKTTLMQATIDTLIESGCNKKNIIYINGDDSYVGLEKGNVILNTLDIYFSQILKKDVFSQEEDVYVFIDHIHFIQRWQRQIKKFIDALKHIRFVISASSVEHLFNNEEIIIADDLNAILLMPLELPERLRYEKDDEQTKEILKLKVPFDKIGESIRYYEYLKKNYFAFSSYDIMLKAMVANIVKKGRYFSDDPKYILENIIERTLYRDVACFYNVKEVRQLERMLYFFSENPNKTISYIQLSDIFVIDKITCQKYLGYLHDSFMITLLESFNGDLNKVNKKGKKVWLFDSSISHVLLKKCEMSRDYEKRMIQLLLVSHYRKICERSGYQMFYWKEKHWEIDLVMVKGNHVMLLAFDFDGQTTDIKRSFTAFEKRFGKLFSISKMMITIDTLDKQKDIVMIPYYLNLFM